MPCNSAFLYLLLPVNAAFAWMLIDEKKSNLRGSGATCVSVCGCGVLTVTSSLKMFDLCTKKERDKHLAPLLLTILWLRFSG